MATELGPQVRSRITLAGLEAARILQMSDYARVDIRLSTDGTPYVIEVNANPYLEQKDTFALAAAQAGITYAGLINRIVETAWQRYEPIPGRMPVPAARPTPRGRGAARRAGRARKAE